MNEDLNKRLRNYIAAMGPEHKSREGGKLLPEAAEALRADTCDACAGTGKTVSGEPCMCGGSGRMSHAAVYLRARLVLAEVECDKLKNPSLAQRCFDAASAEMELFEEVNRLLGCDTDKCNEPGFVWACLDAYVDDYDGSIEVIMNPDHPPLTEEQAHKILALGFGQIYESPAGINWTKGGMAAGYAIREPREESRRVAALRRHLANMTNERDDARRERGLYRGMRDTAREHAVAAESQLDALRAELATMRLCVSKESDFDNMELHVEALKKELAAERAQADERYTAIKMARDEAIRSRDEHRDRLVKYLDSPEGHNVMAALQRDTANRMVDELQQENDRMQQEIYALEAVREIDNSCIHAGLHTVDTDLKMMYERDVVQRTMFDILHQRVDVMGTKVEDLLLRENEPLLLRATEQTRHLG